MAIYSSTLLIKGNLNISDSELIKKLELEQSVKSNIKHQIGKENFSYNDVIFSLDSNNNDVYVSSKDNFTIIVSWALIEEYSGSIGLIKNKIESLFPECEFFFFFSETISMLNGFVWGLGKQIIRKKYVQNGKFPKVYDQVMDLGNLLPQEKEIFTNETDFVNGFPIKNNDYMLGANDFNISTSFIEKEFKIESLDKFFSNLTFNKNVLSELSLDQLNSINNKLQASEIQPQILDIIKPFAKSLKFKKIDFKENGQRKKSIGFYKEINNEKRIVIEIISSSFYGTNGAFIDIHIEYYNNESYSNIKQYIYPNNPLGVRFYSINFMYELCKLNNVISASINNRNELNYLINKLKSELPNIQTKIENISALNFEEYFSNIDLFKNSLQKIEKLLEVRKHIYPNVDLTYCLFFHYLNNEKKFSDSILKLIDITCENQTIKGRHNRTLEHTKKVINKNFA